MNPADALDALAASLRERLLADAGEPGAQPAARIRALVDREAGMLDAVARDELVRRVAERSFGLGPLEPLLADGSVDEIMVSGAGRVWVERGGRVEETAVRFASDAELRHAIERILAPLGRRVDEAEPLCDARLPDGSRVNVVIPPLALDGPALTIRRFRPRGLSPADLVACGSWSAPLHDLLRAAVRARLNVVISGGTGSGKTTLMNAMSRLIDPGERVVTVEDAAELQLQQPHVVRLETRPPSLEGRGEVTQRDLVRNALRMRPDRIIVGEVRGRETFDMLQAMNTGHDGSICTVHSNTPRAALTRVENMVQMGSVSLPPRA
ncbi:MAG TPA: CpaF family protein, partial [Solirubrobacteraceae bacterium]|nr:CpaF family protein [Solirubrobacteraceae bacterium]